MFKHSQLSVVHVFIASGTSVEWAYRLIRAPPYFASKADLWRYAVLYTFGGMYIDDDSDIKTPLDEVCRCMFCKNTNNRFYNWFDMKLTSTPR